jgi:hypothetical protein
MNIRFLTSLILTIVLTISLVGCRTGAVVKWPAPGNTASKPLPPGQAKKLYGHQSARAFAPGQQKKSKPGRSKGHQKGHQK